MNRIIRKKKPQISIFDIYLHQEYGGDIVKRLKKQSTTEDIPIPLISADDSIAFVAVNSGPDEYIAKLFDMQELLDKVAMLLTV
jgi:DNA-binding response OmpR family regulator